MRSHLMIGAASSGSGKTTFTLGLLRALRNRSLQVNPFKCGPDYIDTRHHEIAAGRPSVNLDSFMMSEGHIKDLYARYTSDADVAVTEGVMGLFDGYDAMRGSSAEICGLLRIPVVLVVNAKSVAYSVAPLLYGFKNFRKDLDVVGAVFNFVASESHYAFLRQACEDAGVEALGYLPKRMDIEIPSRHLGLSLDEDFCFENFADRIAGMAEDHVDIDRLLAITALSGDLPSVKGGLPTASMKRRDLRIAIAHDAAFNFSYEENIRFLSHIGHISYFSPIKDSFLPEADFVYLPGGYPELHLPALSENYQMRESIRSFAEAGGKVLAECGGMMYLCETIIGTDGMAYPMVGLLAQQATMTNMRLRLGYRELHYQDYALRGHEFHYSRIVGQEKTLPSVAEAFTAKGVQTDTPLYRYKNVLAGYTHLYWGDPSRNAWFLNFLYGEGPDYSR